MIFIKIPIRGKLSVIKYDANTGFFSMANQTSSNPADINRF